MAYLNYVGYLLVEVIMWSITNLLLSIWLNLELSTSTRSRLSFASIVPVTTSGALGWIIEMFKH